MISVIFFGVIGLSVVIAFAARTGLANMNIGEYLVGGRSFPAWLLYFLAVGEIYSIGTMIGLPSGVYTSGAGHGIWFLGYILMAYPIGYFLAPLIWRAGVRYDAMTIPDVFGRHFNSRTLELITAVGLLVALVPWGQYQFIGLQVVLTGLGLPISDVQAVLLAGGIAFLYLAVSGVRSPAFVAILKDAFMLFGIVAVGVFAVQHMGGVGATYDHEGISQAFVTLSGNPLVFTITTIIFQSVTFYLGFSAAFIFTAKSERAIKSSAVWMPMYMLMYPFLIAGSFYAVSAYPKLDDPDSVFMETTTDLLPEWAVGVVAAAAGLSGLLVLAVTALTIGGIVSRNLIPNVRPQVQRHWTTLAIGVFLVAAAIMTLTTSTLMLTVLNLMYYLLGQLIPGWLAVMFFRRVQGWAVGTGFVIGMVASLVLYNWAPAMGGINAGLVAVTLNVLCVVALTYLRPGPERTPMSRTGRVHAGVQEPEVDSGAMG